MRTSGHISKILVVEDDMEDFESLKPCITDYNSDIEICHVDDVQKLFAGIIDFQPNLIFVDLALLKPDRRFGIVVMFDLADSFPNIPVVIVSATFWEDRQKILAARMLNSRVPLVGVLDKADYSRHDVASVIQNVERNISSGLLSIDSFIGREPGLNPIHERRPETSLTMEFKGDVFERITAESVQTGDRLCPGVFYDLCIEFETIVRDHFCKDEEEYLPIGINILKFGSELGLDKDLVAAAYHFWELRNHFAHSLATVETPENALGFARLLNRLSDFLPFSRSQMPE